MKFTQDNGACNENPMTKITVEIDDRELGRELRSYFGWRKNINKDRLLAQGSHDYDRFIKYLSERGYEVIN